MVRIVLRLAVVLALVSFCVLAHTAYRKQMQLPPEITVATGPPGGMYRALSQSLADEIQRKLNVRVKMVETDGSFQNLQAVRSGKADFALYQPATLETVKRFHPEVVAEAEKDPQWQSSGSGSLCVVANLYSQPAHFIVRRGAGIEGPADLAGKRVDLGLKYSGDYSMSLVLLEHFGLDEQSVEARQLKYEDVHQGFLDDTLDAAFITIGPDAPIFRKLFATGKCELREIPNADALTMKHLSISKYTVPKGMYLSRPVVEPSTDVHTVAMAAQLITGSDVHSGLVREVTQLVLSEDFLKRNRLRELFVKGKEFAQEKPEFAIHPGAQSVYTPDFDIHQVESWEAIYSLAAAVFIGLFFTIRTLRERRKKRKEHKLDRYMHSLLEIEQRQIGLDSGPDTNDGAALQKLLDEVTLLRQEALREFSAHELTEDRAADCFVQMCHALSNKINAKISRQRLDRRIEQLAKTLRETRG